MKKILSLLGTITLIVTSTTSLVACNTQQYSEEELKIWKQNNKINTKNKEIRDNLEWIAPQEKPFDIIDNKYYFVVWRSDTSNNWRIIKFLNDTNSKKELDSYSRYKLIFKEYSPFYDFTLLIRGERGDADHTWKDDNGTYFKFLYRWDGTNEPNTPFISPKTGQITDWNLKQQNNIVSNDEIKVTVKKKIFQKTIFIN